MTKDGLLVNKRKAKYMTFDLGAGAFSSIHLKSTIEVQDHPAELNICLGHSDSCTGVLQSTLMCQQLITSGQGKYNHSICLPINDKSSKFNRLDRLYGCLFKNYLQFVEQ